MATIDEPVEYIQTTRSRPRNTRSNRRVEVRPPEQLRPQARPVDVGMGVAQDPNVATLETLNRALTQDLPRAAASLAQVAKFAKGEAADFAATEAANTSAETYEAFVDEAATPEERKRRSTLNPYKRAALRERLGANSLQRRVREFPAKLRSENERRVAENEGAEVEDDILPVLDYFDDPESYEAFVRTHFELSPDANEHFREGYYGGLPQEIERILRTASEQAKALQLTRVDDSTRTDVGGLLRDTDLSIGNFGPQERDAVYDALVGEVEENASLGSKTDAQATTFVATSVMNYAAGQTNDATFTADKAEVFFDLAKKLAGDDTELLAAIASKETTIRKRLEQTTESLSSIRATNKAVGNEELKQIVFGAVTGKRPLTDKDGNELPATRDNLRMAAVAYAAEHEDVSVSDVLGIVEDIYDGVTTADRQTSLSVSQAVRWVESRFVPEAELDGLLAKYNKDDREKIQEAWDNNNDYYAALENRQVKQTVAFLDQYTRRTLGIPFGIDALLASRGIESQPQLSAEDLLEAAKIRDQFSESIRELADAGDADERGQEAWANAVKDLRESTVAALENISAKEDRVDSKDMLKRIRDSGIEHLDSLKAADTFRGYGRTAPAPAPEAVPSATPAPAATDAAPETATPAPVPMPTPEQKKQDANLVFTVSSAASFIGAGGYDPDSPLAFDGDIALTLVGMTPDVFRDADAKIEARLTPEEWERVNARGPHLLERIGAGLEAVSASYGEAMRVNADLNQQATVSAGQSLVAAGSAAADAYLKGQQLQTEGQKAQAEELSAGATDFLQGTPPTEEEKKRRIAEIRAEREQAQGTEVAGN